MSATNEMSEAISGNRTRGLWSEVRPILGRNKFMAFSIDELVCAVLERNCTTISCDLTLPDMALSQVDYTYFQEIKVGRRGWLYFSMIFT